MFNKKEEVMGDSRNTTVKLAAQAKGHRKHVQQQQGSPSGTQRQQGDHYGEAFGEVGQVRTIDPEAEAEKKANAVSL